MDNIKYRYSSIRLGLYLRAKVYKIKIRFGLS